MEGSVNGGRGLRGLFCRWLFDLGQAEEGDVVGGEVFGEGFLGRAGVFFVPDVADLALAANEPKVAEADGEVGGFVAGVEEGEGPVAVGEFADPDFLAGFGAETPAFFAEGVLVDGEGFFIGEEGEDLGCHVAHVVAGHEWCGKEAPEAEVGAGLGEGEAFAADFEHVGVVPVAGAGVLADAVVLAVGGLDEGVLEVENSFPAAFPALDAVVAGVDVAGGSPEVADVFGPFPWFAAAPFADAEDDGAFGGEEGVAHGGVGFALIACGGVAPVVFEVVDAPGGEEEGVLIFVALAAGVAAAGFGAGAAVDAEFEAAGVEEIAEGFHAGGELGWVWHEVPVGVAFFEGPAVVEDDVGVAGVAHAVCHHGVGGLHDEHFVDVFREGIPGVEAHRWSEGEAFELLGEGGHGEAQEEAEEFFHGRRQAGGARVTRGRVEKMSTKARGLSMACFSGFSEGAANRLNK